MSDREFKAAIVYHDESYADSLAEVVDAAGGEVVERVDHARLNSYFWSQLPIDVALVNLEPEFSDDPQALELFCGGSFQIVFNDPASMTGEPDQVFRWKNSLAGKLRVALDMNGDVAIAEQPPRPLSNGDSPADAEDVEVWVLAASIGGPEAVRAFLAALPEEAPIAVVLVQHIGMEFVPVMIDQLNSVCSCPVELAVDGAPFTIGTVHVVPSDQAFYVTRDMRIRLTTPPVQAYSPCIDQVIDACLERFGASTNVVVFSGMATDGVAGAIEARRRGGEVWVQDPETCVVSSIVDGVRKDGPASVMAGPEELGEALAARCRAELSERENAHGSNNART